MSFVRFLIFAILTLSASFSGAMDTGHMRAIGHGHAAAETTAGDHPACCQDSTERTQTCHALPALLPATDQASSAPVVVQDVFRTFGLLLAGMEPSGPLNPLRAV